MGASHMASPEDDDEPITPELPVVMIVANCGLAAKSTTVHVKCEQATRARACGHSNVMVLYT